MPYNKYGSHDKLLFFLTLNSLKTINLILWEELSLNVLKSKNFVNFIYLEQFEDVLSDKFVKHGVN